MTRAYSPPSLSRACFVFGSCVICVRRTLEEAELAVKLYRDFKSDSTILQALPPSQSKYSLRLEDLMTTRTHSLYPLTQSLVLWG